MNLSSFILENIEPIVQEWETFAGSMDTPGTPLDAVALRDHAEMMLQEIAADLLTRQTAKDQMDKSRGDGPPSIDTAANLHALGRLMSGFTLDQLVSEFRALRASVTKLWMRDMTPEVATRVDDLIRFNEAIDQALAISIASYTEEVQASRDIFLGILGHDLRAPLSAILLGVGVLLRTDELGERATKVSARIFTSVNRANTIVGDLLDFTRSHLGPGIPVAKAWIDVAQLCERIVDESRAIHPGANIIFNVAGAARGAFDEARLGQMFSNLIGNAVQHGARHSPITVSLEIIDEEMQFRVHNTGATIPERVLPTIFNPMRRYSLEASTHYGPHASLGLGLYIAAQIVASHGGQIEVSSTIVAGTEFAVRIPVGVET